ncbi:MAG: prepilin-type N-terminal cleavage/methylation domain-containing protein [Planctomycetia bacterium]|nr:prepilin-type N-terminal cleavage/methylation domain-containing protein [Planctomycetia bacterium]
MLVQLTERRSGFTLIEILVVVTILAVLMAMTAGVVQKLRTAGEDIDCRKDLTELHKAVAAFAQSDRLGSVGYLPSRITVGPGADAASLSYLARLFPKTGGILNVPPATLEGDQCLVFFLAGPHLSRNVNTTPDLLGWSSNATNPLAPGGERITFYEFRPNRLKDVHGNGYYSYLDRWNEVPIAYFSSYSRGPDRYIPGQYAGDCTSLPHGPVGGVPTLTGLSAYLNNVNPDSYQLISAGRNRKFGQSGGLWQSGQGGATYPPGSDGYDDISNFASFLLGGR